MRTLLSIREDGGEIFLYNDQLSVHYVVLSQNVYPYITVSENLQSYNNGCFILDRRPQTGRREVEDVMVRVNGPGWYRSVRSG
jgi:hypothetical protein